MFIWNGSLIHQHQYHKPVLSLHAPNLLCTPWSIELLLPVWAAALRHKSPVYRAPIQGIKSIHPWPTGSQRSQSKILWRIITIQENKLAQMADGLHVLGDTISDLEINYEEVLKRADYCNLTFKPSKVCVCPKVINLFGWILNNQVWLPTEHTTSSLTNGRAISIIGKIV